MYVYSHLKIESNGLPEVTPAVTGRRELGCRCPDSGHTLHCGDNEWYLLEFAFMLPAPL